MLVTPNNVQSLLLALCSKITPGSAWETIWDTGVGTLVSRIWGKCQTCCIISLAPGISWAKLYLKFEVRPLTILSNCWELLAKNYFEFVPLDRCWNVVMNCISQLMQGPVAPQAIHYRKAIFTIQWYHLIKYHFQASELGGT